MMKKTDDTAEGYVYAPWIPVTTASYVNGVRVWDCRWWMNILCKINWFFHFKKRKAHKKYANVKVNEKIYRVHILHS